MNAAWTGSVFSELGVVERRASEQRASRPLTILIIPAGADPLPVAFVPRLANVLTSKCTAPQPVLLVANGEQRNSAEEKIRRADVVLAVAHHSASPQPNDLESIAARHHRPEARRLVLLHSNRRRISGTRSWLASRTMGMHHHVALDCDDDIYRLLRFVYGTARGLIACGGGALCTSQPGITRALMEFGVEIDMVGGASAGSAVAAGIALGRSPEEMDRIVHEVLVERKAMRRTAFARYGLVDHANFDRELRAVFGGMEIEDLWLPFFAVSTNLSAGTLNCHRQGDLWTAIRASVSVPMLLPPICTAQGEVLVDGSLLDNVPVQTMRQLKNGPNVVIAFSRQGSRVKAGSRTPATSPARLKRVLSAIKRAPRLPGPIAMLTLCFMRVPRDFECHLQPEDLVFVPPLPADVGFMDWHRHEELFELGYRWTRKELTLRGFVAKYIP